MDSDGVDVEVIYASHLRHFYDLSESDEPLFRAIAASYNEWLMDFCSYDRRRLNGLPVLSVLNQQGAVEDLWSYAKRGVKGFMIGASVPRGMSYGSPDFDPLWAAAQEADLPLALHISTAKWRRPSFPSGLRSVQTEIQDSLCEMIYGGVFDRFPNLKLVSAEFGIGWVGYWQAQLRDFPGNRRGLKLPPIEYTQRNVWYTFQDDRAGLLTTPIFGADRFLWASDYPHADCTWPDSQAIVDRQFEGIPAEVKQKITRQNAIDLYKLEVREEASVA
jgi:predicted TIM-barrel fold metal-dependent hydrolase